MVQSEKVARRELLEEVSGTAAALRYVGRFYTSNGISNEVAYVYLATGVELGETHRSPRPIGTLTSAHVSAPSSPRIRALLPEHKTRRIR